MRSIPLLPVPFSQSLMDSRERKLDSSYFCSFFFLRQILAICSLDLSPTSNSLFQPPRAGVSHMYPFTGLESPFGRQRG